MRVRSNALLKKMQASAKPVSLDLDSTVRCTYLSSVGFRCSFTGQQEVAQLKIVLAGDKTFELIAFDRAIKCLLPVLTTKEDVAIAIGWWLIECGISHINVTLDSNTSTNATVSIDFGNMGSE